MTRIARTIGDVNVSSHTFRLHRGDYPEPRLNPLVDRDLWMQGYVQTHLERDIRNMEQVSDLETFRTFFSLVCASTGQILNLACLGRDAGASAPTAVTRWAATSAPSPGTCVERGWTTIVTVWRGNSRACQIYVEAASDWSAATEPPQSRPRTLPRSVRC